MKIIIKIHCLLISLCFLSSCDQHKSSNSVNNQNDFTVSLLNLVQSNILIQYESEDYPLNLISGISFNGDSLYLDNYLNSPKLVLRYTNSHCGSCVDEALNSLSMYKERIGEENIIILASLNNLRALKILLNRIALNVTVIAISAVDIPIEAYKTPYFFVLNKEPYVASLFIPIKEISNYTEKYLHTISNRYFAK